MPEWRYRCPRGHASITLGRYRFQCETCRLYHDGGSYPKSELVDLAADGGQGHA